MQERLSPGQHIREIGLKLQGAVDLLSDDRAKIGAVTGIFVTDSSFILVDELVNRVFAFDRQGKFTGEIGRSGEGLGEFVSPHPASSTVDHRGNFYLYDSMRGIVNQFDEKGRFVRELNRNRELGFVDQIRIDKGGNILLLTGTADDEIGVAKLVKFDHGIEQVYSTTLSGPETDSIVIHVSAYSGFCYSRILNRVYYLLPTGFRIKEIDAETGHIVREFGEKPTGYRALPKKYHGMGSLPPEQITPIINDTTLLWGNMFLLGDRYLVVGHGNHNMRLSWLAYDVTSFDNVYSLDTQSVDILDRIKRGWKALGDRLYVYSPPSDEELGELEGRIEFYTLSLH